MADPRDPKLELDRRSFLKGTGLAAAAAAAGAAAVEAQSQAAEVDGAPVGPGAVKVPLVVDGKETTLEVEPRVTLLDALRDYLGATAAKRVCDRGTCGACTVLLGDKPVYACSVLAVDVQGRAVTTARGLMRGDALHPVQEAFFEKDASQCGFCTPGFVVACAAVTAKNPKPTLEDFQRGVDGNICRCGTYEQMVQAIEQLVAGGK